MKIVVLMGGSSDEREVSLASGAQVANALREAGHEVSAVDPVSGLLGSDEERRLLTSGVGRAPAGDEAPLHRSSPQIAALASSPPFADADLVFLTLHGGFGEDGSVQGALDMAGLVYTGSDRLGCSLAMDKEVAKRLLRAAEVPTPDWLALRDPTGITVDHIRRSVGLPVIVKAATGGSSLRLELAKNRAELASAIAASEKWNDLVLCERYHHGREFTVGIVGSEALPVGEILPHGEFFDYECKYQPGKADEIFPAEIDDGLSRQLQELALTAFGALRMRDYGRVDFIVDAHGKPWCLEANASPGMTAASLLPKAGAAAGLSFPALCDKIARLAKSRG